VTTANTSSDDKSSRYRCKLMSFRPGNAQFPPAFSPFSQLPWYWVKWYLFCATESLLRLQIWMMQKCSTKSSNDILQRNTRQTMKRRIIV